MRLEYRLRYIDYLMFVMLHQLFSIRLQVIFVLSAAFLGWSTLGSTSGSLMVGVTFGVLCYLAFWIVQVLVNAIYLFSRRSDGTLTDHVIELRDDALYESTKFNESRFFWPGIQRVVRRPGFVAVYVAQHLAHVIPMRAFGSKKKSAEFVAYIREKMVAA